ncbi:MAG: hypothetical protein BM557_02070 [Flavobacterium sp. MedPE-SWcel]|uniref:hypothetical protein n=1 Tax=uncultured Flavobacterium sp. TaxID=165435 RepID=UPI00091E641A|nr:hypothetical protein [uncultured Flavobacterium sp.]OIQ22184.1 MAG: hypothetical protein BM557_02070 [Flavobacterium sp. MedPE-SWcel]
MDIKVQIEDVLSFHKGLEYKPENNSLEGELFLPDGDSYDVVINLNSYPRLFPIVYETGGRIPVKMDRHVYPESGSLCFTTRARCQILLKTIIKSLLDFINEILIRYLENNSIYEIDKKYPTEEYPHGKRGRIEGYKDILELDDVISTARAMLMACLERPLVIHQNCYCGSKRRLRKCCRKKHLANLRKLYLVDVDILNQDLNDFKDEIDAHLEKRKK